ncbi:hypothetical protein [Thermoanaerobacterium thermosaccharolyticum]|uniref:Lipoprotein n=1 Tax=Thermoanaerobacterium thermosaccharolyticum (strain ATCC 7956 / DSM 571 / NCIMB 9385 / NCA 3814 / NCTC 13789 / WDCM 00135 / 2032) TaxID=580327 RepID=D9TNW6_THETC|nr:hypothetical protein [Thermoanaerobacterium thermosaccharolyticum]ADL69524.1 conserved hypothetical protein [Thermoanaerobacterium thermosaccharolyticum DSM 571]KAA5808055.1 hypothetical protein F1655_02745 [Thermoanaerobacterium thermosaccharolyticum]
MKKLFIALLILTLFLSGCGSETSEDSRSKIQTTQISDTAKNNSENIDAPHINQHIPQLITYNGNHVSAWVNQFLFVENGDLKESYDGDKSYIKLSYAKDNAIKTIDLTSYALKYDLINGIDYITASSSGKYIVLEFSQDVPISVIVDTDTNKSNILWYDESKKESMMRISFNPNNEDEFAFLPSVEVNGPNGSHFLKLYEIKTHKINTVGEISEKDITMQNSLIQWDKNTINVISLDRSKVFTFTY